MQLFVERCAGQLGAQFSYPERIRAVQPQFAEHRAQHLPHLDRAHAGRSGRHIPGGRRCRYRSAEAGGQLRFPRCAAARDRSVLGAPVVVQTPCQIRNGFQQSPHRSGVLLPTHRLAQALQLRVQIAVMPFGNDAESRDTVAHQRIDLLELPLAALEAVETVAVLLLPVLSEFGRHGRLPPEADYRHPRPHPPRATT